MRAFTSVCAALLLLLPGDSGQEDLQGLDEADIICTTPEKFGAPSLRQRLLSLDFPAQQQLCVNV